ncbi:MAG: Maf family protein [Planctomycetota bacterium]|nr:Maf family protein [Planctomycetota bacterium]
MSATLVSPPALVLASTSPRRRELLSARGVAHEAIAPGIDDAELRRGAGVRPDHWTAGLAYLKARAAVHLLGERAAGRTVLGADTIVVRGSMVVSAPRDEADARVMIGALSGGMHDVLTGVALVRAASGGGESARVIFVDRSRVEVGALSEEQIDAYVRSGGWRGKAGGYNLMERLAEGWPIRFEGDATSIMGLPMRRLEAWLV